MIIADQKKFINALVSQFNKAITQINKPVDENVIAFDAYRHYSSGHCAEFALSLAKVLKEKGIESKIEILYRDEISKVSEGINRVFSHCVLIANDESYDIKGSDAKLKWFSKYDRELYLEDSEYYDYYIEWDLVSFDFDNDTIFSEIESRCLTSNVCYSADEIEKDCRVINGLLDGNNNDIEASL